MPDHSKPKAVYPPPRKPQTLVWKAWFDTDGFHCESFLPTRRTDKEIRFLGHIEAFDNRMIVKLPEVSDTKREAIQVLLTEYRTAVEVLEGRLKAMQSCVDKCNAELGSLGDS